MGETDVLAIVDFPGVSEAMKASIALNKALGYKPVVCTGFGFCSVSLLGGA